jgi:hypothetical protein
MPKGQTDKITMSKEMLHEVLCTQLHGVVENAWDFAEQLVTMIEKGAVDEVNEELATLAPDEFDEAKIYAE